MYKLRTNSYVLTLLFVLITFVNLNVSAEKLVTLRFKNKALKEVFKDLYTTIGVKFVYSSNSFDANQTVSGNFSDLPLDQILKHILSNLDVTYTIADNTVVIKRIEAGTQQQILKGRIN